MSIERTLESLRREFLLDLSSGFVYDVLRDHAGQLDMADASPQGPGALQRHALRRRTAPGPLHLAPGHRPADRPAGGLRPGRGQRPGPHAAVPEEPQDLGLESRRSWSPTARTSTPAVLAELWPDADHQLCVFHVIKDINKLILDAVRRMRTAMNRRGKAGRKENCVGKHRTHRPAATRRRSRSPAAGRVRDRRASAPRQPRRARTRSRAPRTSARSPGTRRHPHHHRCRVPGRAEPAATASSNVKANACPDRPGGQAEGLVETVPVFKPDAKRRIQSERSAFCSGRQTRTGWRRVAGMPKEHPLQGHVRAICWRGRCVSRGRRRRAGDHGNSRARGDGGGNRHSGPADRRIGRCLAGRTPAAGRRPRRAAGLLVPQRVRRADDRPLARASAFPCTASGAGYTRYAALYAGARRSITMPDRAPRPRSSPFRAEVERDGCRRGGRGNRHRKQCHHPGER